jgi:hypothetical protein
MMTSSGFNWKRDMKRGGRPNRAEQAIYLKSKFCCDFAANAAASRYYLSEIRGEERRRLGRDRRSALLELVGDALARAASPHHRM